MGKDEGDFIEFASPTPILCNISPVGLVRKPDARKSVIITSHVRYDKSVSAKLTRTMNAYESPSPCSIMTVAVCLARAGITIALGAAIVEQSKSICFVSNRCL